MIPSNDELSTLSDTYIEALIKDRQIKLEDLDDQEMAIQDQRNELAIEQKLLRAELERRYAKQVYNGNIEHDFIDHD